jgi:hypothetical protein
MSRHRSVQVGAVFVSALMVFLAAGLRTVSLGQSAVAVNYLVSAQINGPKPPGAQHVVYVYCEPPIPSERQAFTVAESFTETGSRRVAGTANSICRVSAADVPGYTRDQVGIDWAGNTGYFTWRESCCATTLPPRGATTTRPAPPRVPDNPLRIEVTPVDFGAQPAGQESAGRDAVVKNVGNVPFSITAMQIAEPFAIRGGSCSNTPIAPKTDCTVLLVARPPTPTVFDRPLRVTVSGTSDGFTYTATGEGFIRVTGSDLEALSVGGASFGQVPVGASSAPQAVSVVNAGNLVVRLSRITVPPPFRLVGGGTCAVDQSLTPKANCTLNIVYAPTQAGDQTAPIEVVAISPSKDLVGTGELKGTGTQLAGRLKVTPPAIDFGAVRVGATSPKQTVTMTNEGNAPIPISAIGFTQTTKGTKKKAGTTKYVGAAPGFILNPGKCKAVLNPGASCAFTVVAKPPSRKALAATIQVVGPNAQGSVALSTKGTIRGIAAKPSALVIAPVVIATQSPPSPPISISNIGDEPVVIKTVSVVGPQAAEVVLAGSCTNANLPPQGQCSITVQATPKTPGIRKASIVVTTATKERAAVALQWSAAVGTLVINPPLVDLGLSDLGVASAPKAGSIRNNGRIPVVISKVSASDVAIRLAAQSCIGRRLEPGQECPFTLTAIPSRAGASAATISAVGLTGERAAGKLRYRGNVPPGVTTVPVVIPVVTTTQPEVTTTLPPLNPVLEVNPESGEIGRPATVLGSGYPGNVDVELRWPDGVLAGTTRTGDDGTFAKVIIAMQGRNLGPTTITGTAVGDGARGATATAPYLIKPATFQPQSSRRRVVARS